MITAKINFRIAQGAIIRHARENLKLTRKDVAIHLEATPQSLYSWEHGLTSPTCENLDKLAKLYSCKIEDLFPNDLGNTNN